MSRWRWQRGQQGEQIAADYLRQRGYRIQQRNYRCRQGEVDIIARDGVALVFVEVKTKRDTTFGSPQGMVDRRKQETMTRVAMHYIQRHRIGPMTIRFDVVAILLSEAGQEVLHLPAAFSPSARFYY